MLNSKNQGPNSALACRYSLSPWVSGQSTFKMSRFDETGRRTASQDVSATGTLQTPELRNLEMVVFEFKTK